MVFSREFVFEQEQVVLIACRSQRLEMSANWPPPLRLQSHVLRLVQRQSFLLACKGESEK